MHRNAIVRIIAAVAALAVSMGALSACAPAQPAGAPKPAAAPAAAFPVTLTDDASRTVTLKAPARRIVSLAPANTEIVHALGQFDRLVGVTTYDDYPAQVKDVAKVGDFTAPNIEAVAAAKPDLVLVTGGVQADVLAKLEAVGADVLVVDPKDVEGVYAAIRMVATALGVDERGAALVSTMSADLAAIEKAVATAPRKRAFIEIGFNPLYTAGPGTLLDDLLKRAGGANCVTQDGYVGYSVEQLVKDQPDVYLGTVSSIGDPETLEARPGYSALTAVVNGSIYPLDDNLVSRPGPRVVEGVRAIARALHPDLVK